MQQEQPSVPTRMGLYSDVAVSVVKCSRWALPFIAVQHPVWAGVVLLMVLLVLLAMARTDDAR